MLDNTKGHCVISRANQAVLVPRTTKTIALFPDTHKLTHLDQDFLVVKHDLHAAICLRHLGYHVPNPMLLYYDWKGGTPFAVQRKTCDMMTTAPRCYVLNSMGTGKTKATLWAWDYLHGNNHCGKMLVVATLSTLNFVWGAEAFSTLPHRKIEILHGTKKQRLEALQRDADIYVINHDGLKTIHEHLSARTDIDVLCLDEISVYRNNSDRSKAMRKFAERFKFVWGLTGRPMPQAPTDVWGLAKIVTPHSVPKFFRQAQEMLMRKVNDFKWVPRDNAVETAFSMLQPSVRYSLDAVVELPEVVTRTIDVPLSNTQATAYKKLANAFQTEVQGKTITAVNAAVAMGKLLQISGGWVYAGDQGVVDVDASHRQQIAIDLINENERKVLLFVPYLHAIKGMEAMLDKEGIEYATVHGGIAQAERSKTFNLFQNTDKYKVLLAHPACLAHGLTLTAADMIIWYLPTTSLEIHDQANARITRVGQKHKQQVVYLQSTSVEKKIYSMLRARANVQDALLEMLGNATEAA